MQLPSFLLLLAASTAIAHPGDDHDHPLSESEQLIKRAATESRHLRARSCASTIEAYTAHRRAKRALLKRQLPVIGPVKRQDSNLVASTPTFNAATLYTSGFATSTLSASKPSHTAFLNTTCITAPDVTEGPYYINNEFIRSDLRENEKGITLELDIGVLDTSTCTPLPGIFIELWNANATGQYSGFAAASAGTGGGSGGGGGGAPPSGSGSASAGAPSQTGTMPTGMPGGGTPPSGGGGGGGGGGTLTDGGSGLRGGYPTNADGLVGITTIYPGFYSGRTVHIHLMVHSNWSASSNGTIISKAGSVKHIGQFFFDEDWNNRVMNTTEYANNQQSRTLNNADSILTQANADGNNAFVSLELVGESIEDGLLGYITVGIDTSEALTIGSTNYNGGFNSSSSSSTSGANSTATSNSGAYSIVRGVADSLIGGAVVMLATFGL